MKKKIPVSYHLEYDYPTRYGAFCVYGGHYRWLWLARLAVWFAELFPDMRPYRNVRIIRESQGILWRGADIRNECPPMPLNRRPLERGE